MRLAGEEMIEAVSEAATLREANERLKRKYKHLYEELRRAKESLRHKAKVRGVTPASLMRSSRDSAAPKARPATAAAGAGATRRAWESGRPKKSGATRPPSAPASTAAPAVPSAALEALETHLTKAEARIQQLAQENDALRADASKRSAGGPGSDMQLAAATAREMALSAAEQESLRVALRDREAQVSLLKGRLDSLQAYQGAERRVYDNTVEELQRSTNQLRAARAEAAQLAADLDDARHRGGSASQAAAEVPTLKARIAALEEEKIALLESPFLKKGEDAVALRRAAAKARGHAQTAEGQLAFLRQTVQAQGSEVSELRSIKDTLASTVERLESENASLRAAARAAANSTVALRDKLALYAGVLKYGEGGMGQGEGAIMGMDAAVIPPDELEAALAAVRRKLDGGDLSTEHADVPSLRKQTQTLQLQLLSSHKDLERAERMLGAQSSLARDLAEEVDDLRSARGSEVGKIRAALASAEARAAKAGSRVAALEAEVRTLRTERRRLLGDEEGGGQRGLSSARRGGRQAGGSAPSDASGLAEVADAAVGETSFDELDVPALGPGQNTLEVYVVEASLEAGPLCSAVASATSDITGAATSTVLPSSIASLVMLDFLDYETQASPLAGGVTPLYNFSTSYTLEVDDWLLQYFSSRKGVVQIEVAVAVGASFTVVGQAPLPLFRLLTSSRGRLRSGALPVRSNGTGAASGTIIGSISVEVRVALTLLEAWRALVQADPQVDDALASTSAAWRSGSFAAGTSTGDDDDEDGDCVEGGDSVSLSRALAGASGLAYVLVTVEEARRLVTPSGHPPSPYVQYALPCSVTGPWPVFTGVVRATASPVFAETAAVPVAVSGSTLTALRSQPLRLLLWDDAVAPRAADSEAGDQGLLRDASAGAAAAGLIGTVSVLLEPLAEGGAVRGWFDVTAPGAGGAAVGQLKITVAWDARAPALLNEWHLTQSQPGAATRNGLTLAPPPNAITATQANAVFKRFSRELSGVGALWQRLSRGPSVRADAAMVGVAFRPLVRLLTLSPSVFGAVQALRGALAMQEAGGGPMASSEPGAASGLLPWREALLRAAERAGRGGGTLTAAEATTALLEADTPSYVASDIAVSAAASGIAAASSSGDEDAGAPWAEDVAGDELGTVLRGVVSACAAWRRSVERAPSASTGAQDGTAVMSAEEMLQLLAPTRPAAAAGEARLRRVLVLWGGKYGGGARWAGELLRRFGAAATQAARDAVLDARRRLVSAPGDTEEEVLRALSREYVPVRGVVGVLQGLGVAVVPDASLVYDASDGEAPPSARSGGIQGAHSSHSSDAGDNSARDRPSLADEMSQSVLSAAAAAASAGDDGSAAVAPDSASGRSAQSTPADQAVFAARMGAEGMSAPGQRSDASSEGGDAAGDTPPSDEAPAAATGALVDALSSAGPAAVLAAQGTRAAPSSWLLPLQAALFDLVAAIRTWLAARDASEVRLNPQTVLALFSLVSTDQQVPGTSASSSGRTVRVVTAASLVAAGTAASAGAAALALDSGGAAWDAARAQAAIIQARVYLGVAGDDSPLQQAPSDAEVHPDPPLTLHLWHVYELCRWAVGLDVTILPEEDESPDGSLPTGELQGSTGPLQALRREGMAAAITRLTAYAAACEQLDASMEVLPDKGSDISSNVQVLTKWGAIFAGVRSLAAKAGGGGGDKPPRGHIALSNLRDVFKNMKMGVRAELRGRLALYAAADAVATALVPVCASIAAQGCSVRAAAQQEVVVAAHGSWLGEAEARTSGCAAALSKAWVRTVPFGALSALLDRAAAPFGFDVDSHLPRLGGDGAGNAALLLPLGRLLMERKHCLTAADAAGVPVQGGSAGDASAAAAAAVRAAPLGSEVLAVAAQLQQARGNGADGGEPSVDISLFFSSSGLSRSLQKLGVKPRGGGLHARSLEHIMRCAAAAWGCAPLSAVVEGADSRALPGVDQSATAGAVAAADGETSPRGTAVHLPLTAAATILVALEKAAESLEK